MSDRRARRRLLLVAYFYPPAPASGARRPAALAKWLPEYGWDVDVLVGTTGVVPRPCAGQVLSVPHRPWIERLREEHGIRPDAWFNSPPQEHWAEGVTEPPQTTAGRAYHVFRRTVLTAATYPDRAFGWYLPATRQLRDHLRASPPDAILSTSPPETAHLIARWAQQRARCPWIADLRDPWSQTELADHPRWRRLLDRWTETSMLSRADTLVTVSQPIADDLAKLHPGRRVRAILNGYDPDDFPVAVAPDRSRLVVTYAGAVLPRHDLVLFLQGARVFLDEAAARGESPPLEIRLLGEVPAAIAAQATRFGLGDRTTFEPRVPHTEAVARMRASPVLLFLPWQDPAHPGVYSGKLFEYLGARRPILSVGAEPGVAGELVESTGAGRNARTPAEVAARLREIWDAFRAGRNPWVADEARILEHSHSGMVASFARELDRLVPGFRGHA